MDEARPDKGRPTEVRPDEFRPVEVRSVKVGDYPRIAPSPFVPSVDPLIENLEVFRVGHGLNLGNGGWKAILAWTEGIVKSKW
jgi:hypothetical protein